MIETLITNVDNLVLALVQGSFGSLTPAIQLLWRLMFIVFIAVFGYKVIISGRFSAPELLVHVLKIILLLVIATEWDTFMILIYDMSTDLPSDIAGQIMQGAAGTMSNPVATNELSANQALSAFYDRAMEVSEKLLEGAGWNKWGLYFYAGAIWCGAIGFTAFAAMLIVLAKLAVAILLAVGPLFILLLIFQNTKNLFEGWLRTLLNYAIIPVFVYALLALMLTLAEMPLEYMEDNTGGEDHLMSATGPFLFTSIVAVLLLAQVMNMAASITGGLSLSTIGAEGWMVRTGKIWARRAPVVAGKASVLGYNAARHPLQTASAAKSRIGQAIKNIRGF